MRFLYVFGTKDRGPGEYAVGVTSNENPLEKIGIAGRYKPGYLLLLWRVVPDAVDNAALSEHLTNCGYHQTTEKKLKIYSVSSYPELEVNLQKLLTPDRPPAPKSKPQAPGTPARLIQQERYAPIQTVDTDNDEVRLIKKAINQARKLPNVYLDVSEPLKIKNKVFRAKYVRVTNPDEERRFCLGKFQLYSINRAGIDAVLAKLGVDTKIADSLVPMNPETDGVAVNKLVAEYGMQLSRNQTDGKYCCVIPNK